jgi:hypothetical protein
MGMRDNLLIFSDAQAVTTAAATASTNVIDMAAARDVGIGEVIHFVVSVNTAVTSSGAANVTFALQTDDNVSFSSATTLYTSAAIAKATLVAGYLVYHGRLPSGCERYLRVLITPDTNDLLTGKFDAYLALEGTSDPKIYPKNYTV